MKQWVKSLQNLNEQNQEKLQKKFQAQAKIQTKIQTKINNAQGLIFDLDGTLLDSMSMWDNLNPEFFCRHGVEYKREYLFKIYGNSFEQTAKNMSANFFPQLPWQQIVKEWQAYLKYHYNNTVFLKPGVLAFLQKMQAESKKMCVATMTDRFFVEQALAACGVAKYFDFILTIREAGKGKEYPDIFFQATKKLDLQVEDCVVFEDSVIAAETATAAGFVVCGIIDAGSACEEKRLKNSTKACILDFNELL